ncbi:MAG TPA: ATP-binding protein [Candidatus Kapabacteria bacterium]|nr:ATP-binding protein [Candidatus Kapabacteria bacterium]
MSPLDSLTLPVLVMVIFINIVLMNLVYKNNKKSATNIIFIFLSFIISVWLCILYADKEMGTNLYLARLSIYWATFMNCAFFLLAHTLPSETLQLSQKKFLTLIFTTLVIMFLGISPYALTHVEEVSGVREVVPGPGMGLFAVFTFVLYTVSLYILFKKWKKATGVNKRQLQLVWTGLLLMVGLLISTVMIPVIFFKNSFFISFAPLYTLLFLGMTAIAILKYQLFNVKIVATEALVTGLVTFLLFEGLLSGSLTRILYKTSFAILVGILGIILVRSVKREIHQREEVTHLAQSLEKANLRLQELDQQKTEFLSIASHQLRTPLSILKGYIELIRDGAYGKPTKKLVSTLNDMDESNERLVKLVDEFLDISRIEQGRTKFTFSSHAPHEIIDSVVKEIEDRAKDKNLQLVWQSIDVGQVSMDDEKIRHVVFNFIDNAIKYSEKGSIIVLLEKENDGISIRVKDEGLGFNKTDEVNFYQKFYRGENVKGTNVNGTGLGLYVCRKFIEAHRGYVWAKSAGLGKGSEFGFWIPNDAVDKPTKKTK